MCDLANGRVLSPSAARQLGEHRASTAPTACCCPSAVAVAGDDLYVADAAANRVRRFALDHDDVEPAEYVNGRRADGTFRFDRIGGLAEGSFT